MFVTNLVPCSGIRLHLWPEKDESTSSLPLSGRVVEVTSKMMHIPSGPAPRQVWYALSLMGIFSFSFR